MKSAIKCYSLAFRSLGFVILGIAGFLVFMHILDGVWRQKHERLAHALCDSIPVGMPAAEAKARAYELGKSIPEIEVKDLSIQLMSLNPYSPGDRIGCVANIWDNKIYNNEVSMMN